jgi:exodeoxyribonuclease VII small subunit
MSETAPSLEQALERLEAIVAGLERDDLELEQALRLFEEGIGHLRSAREILANAELRIERLIEEKGKVHFDPVPRPRDE